MPHGSAYPWEAPLGAFPTPGGGTRFRVWAPRARELALDRDGARTPLEPAGHGVFAAELPAAPGDRLRLRRRRRAPARPVQPLAARRPARPVARARHRRVRLDRRRLAAARAARPRALRAARRHVHAPRARSRPRSRTCAGLRELGVTAIELMPVAEFPGRHGWGYDGVYLSAAHSAYGGPLGLQRLVDAAHAEGLAVILDVVYNHLGASGRGGDGGVRPLPDRQVRHAVGQGGQPRRRRLGPGARVDPAVRRALGPRLPPRRPAARRDPRAARLQPRAHRRRDRPPRARARTRARS